MFKQGDAVIVIDMLNDFVLTGAPLQVPDARAMVPDLQTTLQTARDEGTPVLYVCDSHAPDDPEFRLWPAHAVTATKGAAVIDELKPQATDKVVLKHRILGFFEPELHALLQSMQVKRVLLTGLLADICVYFAAVDAYRLGYEIGVLEACVAALSKDDHRWALRQMERILGAEVLTLAGERADRARLAA